MTIARDGSINIPALAVPQVLVNLLSPKISNLNAVATNVLAIIGSSDWGPVDTPTAVGDWDGFKRNYGSAHNRKHDLGTAFATAHQNGATNCLLVRVTDGTDTAATKAHSVESTLALTLTAIYTGSFGNNIRFAFSPGSKANTAKLVIWLPGVASETYDNLPNTAAAFYAAVEDAVNNGNALYAVNKSPSKLVRAAKGTSTDMPTLDGAAIALAGGTDGATGVTASTLVGTASPMTGMYALEGAGASLMILADCDSPSTWAAQAAFAEANQVYAIVAGPSGETVAQAVTAKATALIDSPWLKVLLGDWCWWRDLTNGVIRLVSPQGFAAGRLANLAPNRSGLNQKIEGIIGTQKTGEPGSGKLGRFSKAELEQLFRAGIDVIVGPSPGGNYFSLGKGINSSSNPDTDGDNYTRSVNFYARTLEGGMGRFIGEEITPDLFQRVHGTLHSFLGNAMSQGLLHPQPNGDLPFTVKCDASNNPFSDTSKGFLRADIQIVFPSITRYFVLNMEAGQTVVTVHEQPQL